jgi:hypothetical protein
VEFRGIYLTLSSEDPEWHFVPFVTLEISRASKKFVFQESFVLWKGD